MSSSFLDDGPKRSGKLASSLATLSFWKAMADRAWEKRIMRCWVVVLGSIPTTFQRSIPIQAMRF
jgi:hypothetical protein